ncbi:hypothetical protein [Embleya sp. NPDC020630]|uniref:hypothetical protein n=1 Tax=Embleya sp. NPDC020630 TaxID=3363979 RepID=UPI003795F6E4
MRMRALAYAAATTVLSLTLAACSGGHEVVKSGTRENPDSPHPQGPNCNDPNMPVGEWRKNCDTAPPTPKSPTRTGHVGDTIHVDRGAGGQTFDITLVSVVDPAPPVSTYDWAKPRPGNRYIALQWKVVTGTMPDSFSPNSLTRIADDQGTLYGDLPSGESNAGPKFPTTFPLPPGTTNTGYVTYEIPVTAKAASVRLGVTDVIAAEWQLA